MGSVTERFTKDPPIMHRFALRKYQQEAKTAVKTEWASGRKKTLVVQCTGTGKTILFASISSDLVQMGERVLILAHRSELLDQATDKILKSTGLVCAKEKGEDTAVDSWFRITVGSVQTLMRDNRREVYPADFFDTIIIDEAHHCLSDSYRKILAYFKDAKVLGVTATPDRGDMRNLGEIFESLAYEYPLPRAIKEGYLCKLKALTIPLSIDLSGVSQQAGDFKLSEVDDALMPYLEAIATEMEAHCKDRKTLVFLPLIATSKKMAEVLAKHGFDVREVNCESEDREQIRQWFVNSGKGSVVCNSMLWTEGFDEPSIDCVVILRPTKIRSLYVQCVGRGTRIHPGKDNLLILDFLWMTNKHSLCHPAHLICDNAELADKVTEILAREANASGQDLELACEAGSAEVIEERERTLAEKLAEQKHRKRALVDPLQFEMSIQAEDLADYQPVFAHEMAPPSDKQKAVLEKAGIFPEEIQNAGLAGKLIERIQNRRDNGLTTPKQIRFLERVGFKHVGGWEFSEAKGLIDRIAANNWKVPNVIDPAKYEPIKRKVANESP